MRDDARRTDGFVLDFEGFDSGIEPAVFWRRIALEKLRMMGVARSGKIVGVAEAPTWLSQVGIRRDCVRWRLQDLCRQTN